MLNHPQYVTLTSWAFLKILSVVGIIEIHVIENPENISLQLQAIPMLWHFQKLTN